jgi:hypothetical protein
MSICIVLWMILSRSIHALDHIKRKETKQQQKREQQQLSEEFDDSAHFQPSIQSQHLGGYEHLGEELLRDSQQLRIGQ